MQSVGGSYLPECSVGSACSVGEYPPPEISVNSVNSVGGLAQTNLEWVLWKEFGGLRGYGRDAIPTQPQNYLPTEFTEHTETTGGEEKSVSICAICGRLLSARMFCGFCVFRGRFLSEAMLVQRRPLHPLKIATPQQQDCHATTTRLPRYNNKVATLRQQDCHATTTRLPRYGKMSRDRCKIGWKITPIVQVSSSHYFTDTQHVVRRMEDMVDIFAYSILFIAL